MEHQAPEIFVALEQSGFAAAIRQGTWIYPIANVTHIVALLVFAAAVAVMDLRLAGAFAATAPGRVLLRARTVAVTAFGFQAGSGFLLFAAEASHVVLNPVFLLKMALIGLALLNVLVFELTLRKSLLPLPPGAPLPPAARLSGILSLGLWLVVAACGRSIAYF